MTTVPGTSPQPEDQKPLLMDGNALRDLIVGQIGARVAAAGSPHICLATV
ncbi:MAG: hypothetical protein F2901_02370, partial [Actinobacteria bacterium]|nr:hypothetical protein [Actinomycetota bacterium]